jgi:predicted Ser/Thr protein kinase
MKQKLIQILALSLILILTLTCIYLFFFKMETFYNYTKKKSKHGINQWSKLHASNSLKLEEICLINLEENYKCICKQKKRNHFPKLIKIEEEKDSRNFIISDCGKSIQNLSDEEIKKIKSKNINIKEQIYCILDNLKRAGVYHGDMHGSGKNMTINKDGDLSLIDFDIAYASKFTPKHSKSNVTNYLNYKNKVNNYEEFEQILKPRNLL